MDHKEFSSRGGKARWANKTPEEKAAHGRHMAGKRWINTMGAKKFQKPKTDPSNPNGSNWRGEIKKLQ